MKIDRARVYDDAEDFFEEDGSGIMKLSSEAAKTVCRLSAERGLVVSRIEGGFWNEQGFEARLDCIWDGMDPPIDRLAAATSNDNAAQFILTMSPSHNAFLLTAPPITGWKKRDSAAS